MITLHTFGPHFGLPDPSPFVTKMDVLLKMSSLPYEAIVGDFRQAPKGKMPYIVEDGNKIGDSTLIRLHLEKKHGVDFDKHLTPAEKGIAWAVEKMLEDHLYWIIVRDRWLDDANFNIGPAQFFKGIPALVRPLVVKMVRKQIRKNLHGHGLGRHAREEMLELGKHAIDSLSAILGDKPYLMGANKCGADATTFAFTLSVLCPHFDTPLRAHALQRKNLVAYCERLLREFYPDFASPLTSTPTSRIAA